MSENIDIAIKQFKEIATDNRNEQHYWENRPNPSSNTLEYAQKACKRAEEHEQLADWLEELAERREADGWISVDEALPDNAKHKGALCPRYQVSTKYGVTEGWYNPDTECWFVLVWYKYKSTFVEYEPDFESGDIACVIKDFPVIAWRPLPEPYESEGE